MFEVHVFRRKEEGAENKMRKRKKKKVEGGNELAWIFFLLHRILESFGRSEGGNELAWIFFCSTEF